MRRGSQPANDYTRTQSKSSKASQSLASRTASSYQFLRDKSPNINKANQRQTVTGVVLDGSTWWQRFEDYIWLGNHNFFYICQIHEYCGPAWFRGSPRIIFSLRLALFLIMLFLVVTNFLKNQERLYFTIQSIAVCFFASLFQLLSSVRYMHNLKQFRLLIENKT